MTMALVLVHGNPETDAIWDDLRQHLDAPDVVTLSPPGFGAPVPEGFGATADDYLRWLEAEVATIGGRVDLVGHDWGGAHVMRLACSRPDLIRSWTTDVTGCFDPEFVWHDFAQVWQTPGAGEEAVRRFVGAPPKARAAPLETLGMTPRIAARVSAAVNEEMGRCILALYRSAAQPAMSIWGRDLPRAAARPGLAIIASDDPYTGGERLGRRAAERAGAKVAVLRGRGHWWMCEDPKRGAAVLNEFLSSLG
jgi:pimeloyl-ACP methyl ester carboxylesterase